MDNTLKRIIKEISEELDVPVEIVTKVVRSPFIFTRHILSQGNPKILESLKSVFIMGLGTFHVSERRFNQYKKRSENYYKNKMKNKDE